MRLPRPTEAVRKYVLYQIPGCVIAAVILTTLVIWIDLPPWGALIIFSIWIAKDVALFPLLRPAYESDARDAVERLIGEHAVTVEKLEPSGYVRVSGELWLAVVEGDETPIPEGVPVRVRAVRGTTLIVERGDAAPQA